jgi:hypothetical protein
MQTLKKKAEYNTHTHQKSCEKRREADRKELEEGEKLRRVTPRGGPIRAPLPPLRCTVREKTISHKQRGNSTFDLYTQKKHGAWSSQPTLTGQCKKKKKTRRFLPIAKSTSHRTVIQLYDAPTMKTATRQQTTPVATLARPSFLPPSPHPPPFHVAKDCFFGGAFNDMRRANRKKDVTRHHIKNNITTR